MLISLAVASLFMLNACTNESEQAETVEQKEVLSPRFYESADGEKIYTVAENSPEYEGGIQAMYTFLGENIKYPKEASEAGIQGKVFVTFVVGADGAVRDVKLMRGLGYGTDEEAIRVVKAMPKWKPGSQGGENVAVKYNLPINFKLE